MNDDITKRLRHHARCGPDDEVGENLLREAADIIERLRADAIAMADVLRDIAVCIPSSAHSYNYDSDCDWLLRSCAEKLIAMGA